MLMFLPQCLDVAACIRRPSYFLCKGTKIKRDGSHKTHIVFMTAVPLAYFYVINSLGFMVEETYKLIEITNYALNIRIVFGCN